MAATAATAPLFFDKKTRSADRRSGALVSDAATGEIVRRPRHHELLPPSDLVGD
jgi:hypothetical protein